MVLTKLTCSITEGACLQMLSNMRSEAGWEQGTAPAFYCSTIQALCQTLQAAAEAAPPDIATHPQFAALATDALLASMALSSCIDSPSMHSPSGDEDHTAHKQESGQGEQGGPRVKGGQHEQGGLPPGCTSEGVQELQTGLESVCHAGGQLLRKCRGAIQMQMGSAVMLAALAVVQCASPGDV